MTVLNGQLAPPSRLLFLESERPRYFEQRVWPKLDLHRPGIIQTPFEDTPDAPMVAPHPIRTALQSLHSHVHSALPAQVCPVSIFLGSSHDRNSHLLLGKVGSQLKLLESPLLAKAKKFLPPPPIVKTKSKGSATEPKEKDSITAAQSSSTPTISPRVASSSDLTSSASSSSSSSSPSISGSVSSKTLTSADALVSAIVSKLPQLSSTALQTVFEISTVNLASFQADLVFLRGQFSSFSPATSSLELKEAARVLFNWLLAAPKALFLLTFFSLFSFSLACFSQF